MNKPWIQLSILEGMLELEVYFLLIVLSILSFSFYKFFLVEVSEERHRSLKRKFHYLLKQNVTLTVFYVAFQSLLYFKDSPITIKLLTYLGLIVLIAGCVVFINICRLFILQYFFLTSMRTAVPLLLVNIFTLILTLFLAGWISTSLFGIQVAPLLATSAAFSIILGLALQDTLGNLFAGISLQLDNAFEIGNWVELTVTGNKIIGQISEITWRSIVLIGLSEEIISIPNRIVAQSQISNWTRHDHPIIKAQVFRISYKENLDHIKNLLIIALQNVNSIKKKPAPVVVVGEMQESWITVKVAYFFVDFGLQNIIADEVIRVCLKTFKDNNIEVAKPQLEIFSAVKNEQLNSAS